jgi:hypothetical protein
MALENFGEKVGFIWSVADLLRGPYRPNQYKDVMLPLTVLWRLDLRAGAHQGLGPRPLRGAEGRQGEEPRRSQLRCPARTVYAGRANCSNLSGETLSALATANGSQFISHRLCTILAMAARLTAQKFQFSCRTGSRLSAAQ